MKHSEAVAAIEQMLSIGASVRNVERVQMFTVSHEDWERDRQGPPPGNYAMVETQILIPAK